MTDETGPDLSALGKLANGLDAFTLIADSTVGYRQRLKEGGFSDELADEMAQEYHTTLLQIMEQQLAAQAAKAKPKIGGQFGRRS